MTITPIFHFTCHHCGKAFDLTGERVCDSKFAVMKDQLLDSETAALETAKCLDDTCKDCMSIVYEARAKERDFQAERDLS